MNEGMRGVVEDEFSEFSTDTKTLDNIEIKSEVKQSNDVDVTKDTFNVYISGIDVFGDISTNSRSDVNIIATINPQTGQVLLTTTPRDYYVAFPDVTNGAKDKLTHAGIYGVDCSMNTLEALYGDIDIDFYVRVNFSGVEKIIDAIGGVTVHSDYAFTTHISPHYTFSEGDNEMNGSEALAFARDRKSVPGGERQRGKDQQYVIKGIINKITSPTILTNYSKILEAISGSVQTNLTDDQLKSLVKMQTEKGTEWNVISLSANGKNAREYCYSYQGKSLYVMEPDYNTIEYIEQVMQKVYDGEILTTDDENNMPETDEG
jgi:LCP family protein required for cell wall assembly